MACKKRGIRDATPRVAGQRCGGKLSKAWAYAHDDAGRPASRWGSPTFEMVMTLIKAAA